MSAPDAKQLRNFGLLVGTISMIIAIWPLLSLHQIVRFWVTIFGIVLILAGIFVPRLLSLPYGVWMKVGNYLGWINSRIMLTFLFFGVFTPMGLVMRWMKHNFMANGFEREIESYRIWVTDRKKDHMKAQF